MHHTLHDYHIVSYEVRCLAREIIIHAIYDYAGSPQRRATAVFSEVAGYRFWDDAFGNIILDIEKVGADVIISDYGPEIAASYRMSGAHGPWADDISSAVETLEGEGISGFILSSSIGLSAWILAKDYRVEEPSD